MADPINNVNKYSTNNTVLPSGAQQSGAAKTNGSSFSDALDQANLKFSNHAQKRLETRSIEMNESNMNRLSSAVDKAQAHGAKESLILMDDLAFVVNVRDRMVVTTVDMNRRKEGVFTQIDTVVFADPSQTNTGSADQSDSVSASDTTVNIENNQQD